MDLAGRTALVTGAAGGLGGHLVRALREKGAEVVVSGRNEEALRSLSDRVVVADLAVRDDVQRLVREAGDIDVVVHNAGIELNKRFVELTDEELDHMTQVNLLAPMLLTRDLLPGMLERGRGHVVFIASMSGKVGVSCNEPYAATKAGLIGLTRSLRAEFRDAPVGFSVVSPGFIAETGMYERSANRAPRLAGEAAPAKVAYATMKAIDKDLPDVTVNGTPVGPMLAFGQLAPRAFERFSRLSGVDAWMEREVEARS
jgi:NAD(P)-dependent dehydrogenase (short-subunit alcohol dehydrogenase family)